jgi:F-type H+-transporting ATPase subunit O
LPGVSGRYASSLYDAAAAKGISAKVEDEVKRFKELITANPALKVYLDSPIIPKPERTQSLDTVLGKLGSSDVFKNLFRMPTCFINNLIQFLDVLVENRRTEFTSAVLDDYLKFMKAERREIEGTITTAKPLTPQELDKIKVFTTFFFWFL